MFHFSKHFFGNRIKCVRILAKRMESGYVNVNNANIFYERAGHSEKTLLCIPGALGTTRSDFSYQLDHLSKTFTVVCFDPRGYGKSQKAERKFDSDFFHVDARDAAKLMESLGIPRYSVLGWSDGGICGIILTATERVAVENFILWGSNAFVSDDDMKMIEKTRDLSKWSERMRAPLEATYGKEGLQTIWNQWMDGYNKFHQNENGSICINELSDISCPTLIVHGMKDPMLPEFHPDFIHERIKGSKLIKWPNGKHNLHMRYHDEFNELVTKFILESEKSRT